MTKKRRMFDIDLPEDDSAPAVVSDAAGAGLRRGPMATAIGENAESLRERQVAEAAIRSENDSLAHEFVRLKRLGLVTDMVPIDAVVATKLVRDRAPGGDAELEELKASILAVGLSNPIRVEPAADGSYELVQGWRRLSAYRALYAETGDEAFARIPAGLMAKGESLDGLYRRMVDENMVRKDISFAEMAQLARSYASDEATECRDLDEAVNRLFATANPQKRSYIRRFAFLLSTVGESLRHAEAVPRALGLAVANRLEGEPGSAGRLVAALKKADGVDATLDALRRFADSPSESVSADRPSRGRPAKRGKTTLRLPLNGEEVRCTAIPGKVELRAERDFSTVDQARLEAAIEAFFAALD
ncbi:MAG: replication protein [Rhodobacteraceae bacterium PARR1]|nr:MAG: replication protein [Rhodobacteraceae bacterium PARR1]